MNTHKEPVITLDERLRLPCGICGKQRSAHVGRVLGCFGGYGTYWNPDGERDHRVWPEPAKEAVDPNPQPISRENPCYCGPGDVCVGNGPIADGYVCKIRENGKLRASCVALEQERDDLRKMLDDLNRVLLETSEVKSDPHKPSLSMLVKLGSLAVHADELASPDGHHFDVVALRQLIEDPEVRTWVKSMGAFLPVKRKTPNAR